MRFLGATGIIGGVLKRIPISQDSQNNYRHVILSTNNKEGVHFKTNTLFILFKIGYGYYSAKGFSVG